MIVFESKNVSNGTTRQPSIRLHVDSQLWLLKRHAQPATAPMFCSCLCVFPLVWQRALNHSKQSCFIVMDPAHGENPRSSIDPLLFDLTIDLQIQRKNVFLWVDRISTAVCKGSYRQTKILFGTIVLELYQRALWTAQTCMVHLVYAQRVLNHK